MENPKHFCTCGDVKCGLHPQNHDLGCDPCIRKNLKNGEIPGCFFRLIRGDLSKLKEFTIESFVRFYEENTPR